MPTHRSYLLSIALTPTSARLAEVKRSGDGVQVLRQSTLLFAPDAGLAEPAALGAALAEHFKSQGYSTTHAVVGLCPRWVLTRHKSVPPADADAMRGIVNLQIEREFAASSAEMSFDYLHDAPTGDQQSPLLLAAVRSTVLRQVEQALLSAGLKLEAITPTTLAASPQRSGTVVLVEQGVAGVMRVRGGRVMGLVSCPVPTDGLGDEKARSRFLADLSRCMLQLPGGEADDGVTLLLPDSVSQADAQQLNDAAAERFGQADAEQADAAVLLAGYAMRSGGSIIDFTESRLAPPPPQRFSATTQWAIRAALVVILIGGAVAYLWFDATSHRDALQAEYDAIKDKAAELEAVRANIRKSEGWYDKRPPALDCLLELTRTFPKRGEIRVETLSLNGNMTGEIECTAEDWETMDSYFRGMQRSTDLLELDLGAVRSTGGRSNWIDFPIAFRFDKAAKGGVQ